MAFNVSTRKLFVAKVNVNANLFSYRIGKLDFNELIKKVLLDKIVMLDDKQGTWLFVETNLVDDNFIEGKLCRSTDREIEKLDRKQAKTYTTLETDLANSAIFIYDIPSELIVFEEIDKISAKQFTTHFARLCSKADMSIGELIIEILPNKEHIISRINNIERVTEASLALIPANFIPKKEFAELDKFFSDNKIKKSNIRIENKAEGLNTDDHSILSQAVGMAISGYGQFKIKGFDKEGKVEKINSEENSLTKEIEYNKENDKQLIKELYKFLHYVKSYFWGNGR